VKNSTEIKTKQSQQNKDNNIEKYENGVLGVKRAESKMCGSSGISQLALFCLKSPF